MNAIELTYKLCGTPIFYLIAKNIEQDEVNLYGISTRIKNVEHWIKTEQELSRSKLGGDYVYAEENSMEFVRAQVDSFTKDVLFQRLLEAFYTGLYEVCLEYIGQLRMREKIS